MISLKKARSTIFSTECGKCIKEGLECSEPIITQDENGLIDNYFVYGCDSEGRHFTNRLLGLGCIQIKKKLRIWVESLSLKTRIIYHRMRLIWIKALKRLINIRKCIQE